MTYPLVLKFDHSIYGILHDNVGRLSKNFVQQKIISENSIGATSNYTNYPIGHDYGHDLIMYTNEVINYFFVYCVPNPIAAFNAFLLFKFTMAAFMMYLLIDHIIKDNTIAFIGGFFYAFSPYYTAMVKPYGGQFISFLLPFFILRFIKFGEFPNITNFLFLILSYVIFFGEHYYYSYFVSVALTICLIIFLFVPKKIRPDAYENLNNYFLVLKNKKIIISLLSFLTVIVIVAYFFYANNLAEIIQHRVFTVEEAKMRSVKSIFYFLPSVKNTFLGPFVYNYIKSKLWELEIYELTVYLGFIPVLIIFLTFIYLTFINKKYSKEKGYFYFFLVLLLVSIWLSLGPTMGLSYPFFYIAPMFRFICRYHIVTLTALIVTFSIGLMFLLNNIKIMQRRLIVLSIISTLVFVEYCDYHFSNVLDIQELMPKAYRYLSIIKGSDPIIELNNTDWPAQAHLLAFQLFHHKKTQTGHQNTFQENICDPEIQKKYKDQGFKYVVVVTNFPRVTYPPLQCYWPDVSISMKPIKEFGYLRLEKKFSDSHIYRFVNDLSPLKKTEMHVSFTKGWSGKEFNRRWSINTSAQIKINVKKDTDCRVSLSFDSIGSRDVTVSYSGRNILDSHLPSTSIHAFTIKLEKGDNYLNFTTNKEPLLPGNGDPRKLSFALLNYSFEEDSFQ